jgi:cobalt-zinc-cadmium efflux system membrane fusion protein
MILQITNGKSRIITVWLFSILILISVSCNHKQDQGEIINYLIQGDTIVIPDNSNIKEKLLLYTLKEESFSPQMVTAGIVKAIPNYYAEIAPPFAGRITKVYLKLGMKTEAGTPLFEMTSPDFIDAQKYYFQAKSQLESADLNLKRQQDLQTNGVGAQRNLEEAATRYDVQKKEYENAVASLKIFNVNVDKLVFGQPLVIASPIAGEVITNDIVMGNYLKTDDAPRAKVAELSKVWVAGQVKEKDLRFIHELDGAEVQIAAFPEKKIVGKIYHVNEIVDEDTRSVQILIECENKDRDMKPGMYVTVKFIDVPENVFFVPAKAILQMDDNSFVFIQAGKGRYIKRKVQTGSTENGRIMVTSGLQAGDVIISEGGFYLLELK